MTWLLLLLFWFHRPERIDCGDIRSETKNIYKTTAVFISLDGEQHEAEVINGKFISPPSTSTLSLIKTYKIGEEPDLEAIEYNKEVRECRIKNY